MTKRSCESRNSKIGHSRGIILSKAILEQCHFEDNVEMEVSDDALIIRPLCKRREGWKESFKKIDRAEEGQSLLEWQNVKNQEDAEDLEW